MVRVAFDEQIFAIQTYGGISRMFAELARQFTEYPELGVDLLPLSAPIINRYVLDNDRLKARLSVWDAGHEYKAIGRYFMRVQPRRRLDVVHNTFYLPHGLAGYPGAKRVVTVHDMIPELMPKTRRRLDFVTLKKRYVMSADHVICVSEFTREDLVRTYGPIKAPISVVNHGVDPGFQPGVARPAELPDRYVLFVGNRGQYKDAAVLMRAFATIAKVETDLSLLFVGGGVFSGEEHGMLRDLGIQDRVRQLSLPDGQMPGAYGNALMCVFPSRFEGFGLPALEAMACGTPTILARATSLPEVGGNAAAYFTPGDDRELAAVMAAFVDDEGRRDEYRRAGIERARKFTWRHAAEETAAIYRSVL
jgi:glycosyltransferase involved in cell wall biosynthesis